MSWNGFRDGRDCRAEEEKRALTWVNWNRRELWALFCHGFEEALIN